MSKKKKWIEWTGGDNPVPDKIVKVKLGNGKRNEIPSTSISWRWTTSGSPFDIISYRVVKPKTNIVRVADGEKYWLIYSGGDISCQVDQRNEVDYFRWLSKNYFNTKEQAQKRYDKIMKRGDKATSDDTETTEHPKLGVKLNDPERVELPSEWEPSSSSYDMETESVRVLMKDINILTAYIKANIGRWNK